MKWLMVLALVAILPLAGCAGTLHYGTYAEAQQKAYQSRMEARARIVEALAKSMQSSSEGTRMAGAMAIAVMLSRDPSLRMEAPRDQITQALGIVAPIFGMWGIADTVGRHMSGHGGTHVTAGDRATIGVDGSTVTGPSTSLTVSGDQAQGGIAGGDQTLTNSPQRDTGNTTTN